MRALISSCRKAPAGGLSDCVVIIARKPSGLASMPPRSWPMMLAAWACEAISCSSSSSVPTGLTPVSTEESKLLILSCALVPRWVIVLRWSCTWNRSTRNPSGSDSIMPTAWLKARAATSLVGPINRNSARGRSLASSAVIMIPAPPVVFEFFLGTRLSSSRTMRSPDGSSEPNSAPTMSRNQSPAASASGGLPMTSGRWSLSKMPMARRARVSISGRSGTRLRPSRNRCSQSRQAKSQHAGAVGARRVRSRGPASSSGGVSATRPGRRRCPAPTTRFPAAAAARRRGDPWR